MRIFLDAKGLSTAAHNLTGKAAMVIELGRAGIWRLATSRAALGCRADVLLTGDLRDFGFLMSAPEKTSGLLIQTVAAFLASR